MDPLVILGGFFALVLIGIVLVLVRDVIQNAGGSGLLLTVGFGVLFIGEYFFGEGDFRLPISGVGLLMVIGAVVLRYVAMTNSTEARHHGHQQAMIYTSVAAGSLILYGLSLDVVASALFSDEDAAERWSGVWQSLFPLVALIGLVPTYLIDWLLSVHPRVMPEGASRSVQLKGVSAALAIALMFPLNYLASSSDMEWDLAYFRTTRAGESSQAIVTTLIDPVEVLLFYPSGNEVSRELERYFKQLANAAEGRMTVRDVDQAVEPVLAEELGVRDNGYVVFRQGEATEKFKVNENIDRARSDLRTLDSTVQEHLIKLTRGKRTVYFLSGHGEATWRERENPFRKLNLYKRELLEGPLSLKVKAFGVADGSTNAVPDDAEVVVVSGPLKPLLPEEIETLKRHFDDGGSLLIMVDPEGDPMTELLAHLGVVAGEHPLAHTEAHARIRGPGPGDRTFLATNKYGSHASVKQLSRNSSVAHMVFDAVTSVTKLEGTTNKVTTLIRSVPNTFIDVNGNFEPDDDEQAQVWEIAAAVTRPIEGAS